jgi:hypothetical protein
MKRKKTRTEMNLGCVLDQAIGKEDEIFHI